MTAFQLSLILIVPFEMSHTDRCTAIDESKPRPNRTGTQWLSYGCRRNIRTMYPHRPYQYSTAKFPLQTLLNNKCIFGNGNIFTISL